MRSILSKGLLDFTGVLISNWWTLLSGAFSVPATFLALWFSNDIAKIMWGLAAFFSLWVTAFLLWKSEHNKLVEHDQGKRLLLDEISALRETMVRYRIEMETDCLARRFDQRAWQQKYETLEERIATKIEQLSSRAEAITYRNRGNIPRPINPTGGYVWPVLIDTCIYDLDYLKTLIHDYARGGSKT